MAFLRLDPSGRIEEINLAGATLLRIGRDRAIGRPFTSVVDVKDVDAFLGHLTSCVDTSAKITTEVTFTPRRSGTVVVQMTSVAAFPRAAVPKGLSGVVINSAVTDISNLKNRENRWRFFADAGETLAVSLDYRSTLATVMRLAVPLLADLCVIDAFAEGELGGVQRQGVTFADEDRQRLFAERVRASFPDPDVPAVQRRVLASGQPLLVSDIVDPGDLGLGVGGPGNPGVVEAAGLTSAMCVPLVARGEMLGTMTFAAARRRYTAADLQFAGEVARRSGIAIENARLFETARLGLEAERKARADANAWTTETAELYKLADAANRADTPDVACEAGLDAVERLLGIDRSAVTLFDGTGTARFAACRGLSDEYRRATERHSPWPPHADNAEPVVISDAQLAPEWADCHPAFKKEGIRSLACIPMIYGERHLGTVTIYGALRRALDVRELQLTKTVASHVAQAIGRLRAQEALRGSQRQTEEALALLDTLRTSAPAGIAYWDRELRFVKINHAMAEVSGLPAEQHIGRKVTEVFPAEIGERISSALRRVLDTSTAILEQELPGGSTSAPGRNRDWLASYYPVPDYAGNTIGVGVVALEITARKRAEWKLRFLSEASGILASSLDNGTIMAKLAALSVRELASCCILELEDGSDPRVKVAAANPDDHEAVEALAIYQSDPNRPRSVFEAVNADRPMVVPEISEGFLRSIAEKPEHAELWRKLRASSLMTAPLVARGRVLGSLTFIRSVPGPPYGEDDLRFIEEIAGRAALAIENGRLYRESQAAIHARENLLAVVAHDLRNPLATILMSNQSLLRRVPNDRRQGGRRQAEAIQRSAERMERLIQDLLDLASIEAGRLKVERHTCTSGTLINEVLELQQTLAIQKSVNLRAEVVAEDAQVQVLCDRERIDQVFSNLIGNAVKFTPAGGDIVVGVESHEDEVWFSVSDTGPGIAPEQLPRIFETFWQARDTARMGTGLGLSIAKGIVESHGGRIWAKSEPGAGSVFTFSLPRAAPQAAHPAAAPSFTNGLSLVYSSQKGGIADLRTVLVVDDDDDVREAMTETLRDAGYGVVTAANGAEAIKCLQIGPPPSLILLDLQMPVMDGWAFLKERDKDPALKSISVIVISGQRDVAARLSAIDAGYIQKPIRPSRLFEMMERAH